MYVNRPGYMFGDTPWYRWRKYLVYTKHLTIFVGGSYCLFEIDLIKSIYSSFTIQLWTVKGKLINTFRTTLHY